MDWYYGSSNNNFVVPKDQDLLDRHPSPDSWSNWGISSAPEGNFIEQSTFNNEIEFEVEVEPSLYDKDQTSSSSVCGKLPEQSFQQTETFSSSCDHQSNYKLEDLSSFEQMDDIFLDSVLEDFPSVEDLHKSFYFYPENKCSNTPSSECVPCNSNSMDCQDIEEQTLNILEPLEQSSGDEAMFEQSSVEESTLNDLEMIIAQFNEKTRICFRDALYRLARNTKQNYDGEDLDGDVDMQQAVPLALHNQSLRSEDKKPMESETNNVDRAVANLMFNKMETNILDLPLTIPINFKQGVFGNKSLQRKSSKALNIPQKSHYNHSHELQGDAEVPRFGSRDQQTATELHTAFADPIKKSSLLEFG